MSTDERVTIPVDEAMERLAVIPDYDPGDGPGPCVHTFADSTFGLLGAHWKLDAARAIFERCGVEESGPMAAGMRHGLVVIDLDEHRTIFFETKEAEGVA